MARTRALKAKAPRESRWTGNIEKLDEPILRLAMQCLPVEMGGGGDAECLQVLGDAVQERQWKDYRLEELQRYLKYRFEVASPKRGRRKIPHEAAPTLDWAKAVAATIMMRNWTHASHEWFPYAARNDGSDPEPELEQPPRRLYVPFPQTVIMPGATAVLSATASAPVQFDTLVIGSPALTTMGRFERGAGETSVMDSLSVDQILIGNRNMLVTPVPATLFAEGDKRASAFGRRFEFDMLNAGERIELHVTNNSHYRIVILAAARGNVLDAARLS
jgi:hypothetical protein